MTSDLARFCDFVKSGFGCTAVQTGMAGIPATYAYVVFLSVFCLFEEFGIILHVDLLCCMKNRLLRRADDGQIFQQSQTA